MDGREFIGGSSTSIADIRFAATLEFLRAIDYEFPGWADDYMVAMEGHAQRGVLGAGGRRARLHRARQVAVGVRAGEQAQEANLPRT
jgi:glutathione S-transferase